jgi:hypothetical protein
MIDTKANTFTVTLTSEAYRIAERRQEGLKQLKNTEQKADQIYLNTLAVYAVAFYCRCMGIETSWQNSNIFDVICTILLDVSDIELVGLGKLECRPVLPGEMNCFIPSESREFRIGCVAVEVDNSTKEATILGFYPSLSAEKILERIPLHLFNSIDYMLDHLLRLELELEFLNSNDSVAVKTRESLVDISPQEFVVGSEDPYHTGTENDFDLTTSSLSQLSEYLADEQIEKREMPWKPKELINLSRWLLSSTLSNTSVLLENGYLEVSEYLQKFINPNLRLMNTMYQKTQNDTLVNLSALKPFQLDDFRLILQVSAEMKNGYRRDLVFRACMDIDRPQSLPKGLQLIIFDGENDEFIRTEAKSFDNIIGVEFIAEIGDRFRLQVILNQHSFIENYVFS